MKVSPKYIADQQASEDALIAALKRRPFEECLFIYYEFSMCRITEQTAIKQMDELGWTWEDFCAKVLSGPSGYVVQTGNETLVVL